MARKQGGVRLGLRSRGPYRKPSGASTYEDRVAAYAAKPHACRCGCGQLTEWDRSRRHFKAYIAGHYRQAALYKDEGWLRARYLDDQMTAAEIAAIFGIDRSGITRYLKRLGIPARDRSESRKGRMVGPKNPAWRGGISTFPYSSDWDVIARRVREEAGWACEWCGLRKVKWGRGLHVHHIDGDKRNNARANLVALCAPCHHGKAHGRGVKPTDVQQAEAV